MNRTCPPATARSGSCHGLLACLLALSHCAGPSPAPLDRTADAGPIVLVDRRGERLDITHAIRHYGMDRSRFQYGLGKGAIPPLDHPDMIAPQDPSYPAAESPGAVIGTELGGDARAYPILPLSRHEVVNETIGATPAAVAY